MTMTDHTDDTEYAPPTGLGLVPEPDQYAADVAALNAGPIELPGGQVECRACGSVVKATAYGAHVRMAHVNVWPPAVALRLDSYAPCELCGAPVSAANASSMKAHLRERHGVRQRVGRPVADGGETHTPEPTALARVTPKRSAATVTPTDAGLAVLSGLCSGAAVPVDMLGDVVAWLDETNRLVRAILDG